MAAWTKTEAKEMLLIWLEAEKACASGKSYKIGSRTLERADLSEIAERIKFWRKELEILESGKGRGARVLRAVPRDL